ncbi:hypothetical protein U1Q18_030736, partial [Sarracenia purpurea var. burkii]
CLQGQPNTSLGLKNWFTDDPSGCFTMTRGNQRERDRERAQARGGGAKGKGKDDGLTPEQRRERDAKALQEKAAKKAAQAAGAGDAGSKSSSKK